MFPRDTAAPRSGHGPPGTPIRFRRGLRDPWGLAIKLIEIGIKSDSRFGASRNLISSEIALGAPSGGKFLFRKVSEREASCPGSYVKFEI